VCTRGSNRARLRGPSTFPLGRSQGAHVSRWRDSEAWAAQLNGSACPICKRGEPLDLIADLDGSWLTMQESAPVRGYVCLVAPMHVIELHDMAEEAAVTFMRDARAVSRALSVVTGAVKLNYEIYGNSLPHFHMHIFPRYIGDHFEGRPIDPRLTVQPVYMPGEFASLRKQLVASLQPNKRWKRPR